MIMNGLLRPILSLQKPEKAFNSEAVLSAMPSMSDKTLLDAPIDIKNNGITLYSIFVDTSIKKLVNPIKKTLRSNPNIVGFLSIIGGNLVATCMLIVDDSAQQMVRLSSSKTGNMVFIVEQYIIKQRFADLRG
ncbi:hypothetical protein FACS1894201_11310 [Bacteroidia bacterium]|nr:hypothetical protein FACS1894201_11310 [Bacteroidia bacterium]